MAYRYPKVEVFVEPRHNELASDDGGRDIVRRVEVDGVPWPVTAVDWHGANDSAGATIQLTVRGQLRITEEAEAKTSRMAGLSPVEGAAGRGN